MPLIKGKCVITLKVKLVGKMNQIVYPWLGTWEHLQVCYRSVGRVPKRWNTHTGENPSGHSIQSCFNAKQSCDCDFTWCKQGDNLTLTEVTWLWDLTFLSTVQCTVFT